MTFTEKIKALLAEAGIEMSELSADILKKITDIRRIETTKLPTMSDKEGNLSAGSQQKIKDLYDDIEATIKKSKVEPMPTPAPTPAPAPAPVPAPTPEPVPVVKKKSFLGHLFNTD